MWSKTGIFGRVLKEIKPPSLREISMNTFCNNTILDKNVTNYFLIVKLTAILIYMKNTCEENHSAMQKKKTNNCDIHVNQQGGLYLTAVHFQLLTNVNEEVESLGKPTKFMIFLRQRNILSITMMNRTTETRF